MTPGTLALVDQAMQLDSKADVLSQVTSLRKQGHSAELVAAVLTQAKLRRRARAKFGEFADQMLFTEAGLEQATRLPVAAIHANRFRKAGIKSLADLGCGIGSDALSFAALGLEVTAVEKDEVTAAIASYNLASFENAKVIHADVTAMELSEFEALWFDPARRDISEKKITHRKLQPKDFSPNLDWVFDLAQKKPTGVKLAPGFDHDLIPKDCEAQWVSHHGELVELTLWFGKLANGNIRSALKLGGDKAELFIGNEVSAQVGELGKYIFEPDPALIRSHLLGDFANKNNLRLVSDNIAYLSADVPSDSGWLKTYELLDVLPLEIKTVKKYLAERNVGIVEIKKRGVDITPEDFRKQLSLKGTSAATLILTKVGGARKTLVVKPIR